MGGGLMQIITYGTQDLTLTGNPEITFFNIVYRRYTNFGIKIISLSFDNSPEFNSTSYANIPKNNGDLLSKIILKIKLPKIDLTYINNILSNKYDTVKNNSAYKQDNITYYSYFIEFYNKLKNIINIFFLKYNANTTSLTYISDLKSYILKYFNIDQYSQFFLSINFFFNNIIQTDNVNKYNIDLYINSSLFKIIDSNLVYIYELFSYDTVSYEQFKFTVNKNMEILHDLNNILYDKLTNTLLSEPKIKFCWVNKIAQYLFDSIELYIGSNKIYSLSDTYINNYSELYYKNKSLYNLLIGNKSNINTFSYMHDETELYLPIPFWSFSNYGLSFPLIALQYNSLQIKINTKKFLECIRINYNESLYNSNIDNEIINLLVNNMSSLTSNNIEITLLLEYIYLDTIERKKFAQSAHEYLIEQVQEIEFDRVTKSNNTIQIDIFHCCKDMFWFAQKIFNQSDIFNNDPDVYKYTYSRNNIELTKNESDFITYVKMIISPFALFNADIFYNGLYVMENNTKYINKIQFITNYISNMYIHPIINDSLNIIIAESYFSLNGVQLTGENSYFYNYLQPYNYYNATPQLGLNIYSLCLRPTEFQPSGSCNMSRISFIALKLKINDKISDDYENYFNKKKPILSEYKLIFQARNFNILRIIGGIGATAFTY